MIRTVAKHRYFKGKGATRSVRQYIGYVAYRGGAEANTSGRQFFDEDSDRISSAKIRAAFVYNPVPGQPVLAHELILSPGVQSVDAQRYTRVLMDKLERSLGRNLKWAAVEHKGRNNHIHVFIDGRDKDGMRVYLRREEHKRLREWGDRYLEKEHGLERYLDKEIDLNAPFEREKGDALYETMFDKADKASVPQIELAPENSKKLFGSWNQTKAIAELADEDKIYFNGKSYHQFNTTKDLYGLLKQNHDDMSDEQITKVKQWIVDKESFGDDHHERLERETLVRQKRRFRKPRKNKKQDNKQDAKDSAITRGKRDRNEASLKREARTINLFNTTEDTAEGVVRRGDQLAEPETHDEEAESRIQIRKVEEERIAQLKVEVEEAREFKEKLDKGVDELKELDLKATDDALNADETMLPDIPQAEEELKHQARTTDDERQKVELKLEQERNSRTTTREYKSILQGYRGYLKNRSAIGLQKQPRLQRLLHESDRDMLWKGRYTGSANQADLHELLEGNSDLPMDGTTQFRDKAELEANRDESFSTANPEHRNLQPHVEHLLSLPTHKSETLEELMGLDINNSVEKTNHENDNPTDQTQENRNKNDRHTGRDEDEWKR